MTTHRVTASRRDQGRDVPHSRMYPVQCAHPDCSASYPSSRWAAIRAFEAGWYQQRDGRAWCPEHVPGWARRPGTWPRG